MSAALISSLTFVAVSLLIVSLGSLAYDHLFRYRLTVRDRLRQLEGDPESDVKLFKDIGRMSDSDEAVGRSWLNALERIHDQAGTTLSLTKFAIQSLGCAVGAALLGFVGEWWICLIAAPLALGLPLAILLIQRRRRQRTLERQLPEAFEMISRAVRAGQTIPAAMQIVAQDFAAPVSDEFRLCYEQQNLGIARENALKQLARRTGSMELQIFVVALLVQAKSGGDVVELLDNLANMNRKRLKLAQRVRALTGEGRMQAVVLAVLPIVAFLGVMMLSPDYAKCLLDRPWLLLSTAFAELLGTLWIRRIINFEY